MAYNSFVNFLAYPVAPLVRGLASYAWDIGTHNAPFGRGMNGMSADWELPPDRRVRVRVATATRPRNVIDIGLMDRRRERTRWPVSRLGRSHSQAGHAYHTHGDPIYFIVADLDVFGVRWACITMQAVRHRSGHYSY